MKTIKQILLGAVLATLSLAATADNDKADIKVMTQNQYLGADLGPIISAQTEQEYGLAIVAALQSVAANNIAERSSALAESIADRRPHLAALQEVFAFDCIEVLPNACYAFQGAFNDHLELTMQALEALGADYYIAAEVQNLTIPTPFMESVGLPGLPVYFPGSPVPALFVSVIDRDVILARSDVPTTPVPYPCAKPSLDGCNFSNVATVNTLAGPISVERGFVGVDTNVKGNDYRFVNTHLEVHILGGNPMSAGLQSAQASQLSYTLNLAPLPSADTRFILAGDINSSPDHAPIGPFIPPYQQFTSGVNIFGSPDFVPLVDTWLLRPGSPDGYTCCEAADLLNGVSEHSERIDVVLARPAPATVKANVMDAESTDKTASGLWPSDHASVIAELSY